MESNASSVSWLHGLQEYFNFKDQDNIAKYCSDFLKVGYSENKAHSLRNVITEALPEKASQQDIFNVVNFFSHTANSQDNIKLEEISSALTLLFPNEPAFKVINKYYRLNHAPGAIQDAFSRGQVNSKIWLAQELAKIKNDFPTIFLFAGWFGQLSWYLDHVGISYKRIRNFDIDPIACEVSDKIFNIDKLENFEIKSSELDINNLDKLYKTGLEFPIKNYSNGKEFSEKRFPSLVINTSSEHFNDQWYHKIVSKDFPNRPFFAIQSNNLHDVPEHINTVHSSDELLKKFPMQEVHYKGEIELYGYKRFMLIGRP